MAEHNNPKLNFILTYCSFQKTSKEFNVLYIKGEVPESSPKAMRKIKQTEDKDYIAWVFIAIMS